MTILHLRSSEFFGGPERAIVGQCKYYRQATMICASFVRPGIQSDFLSRCAETGVITEAIPERYTGDFSVVSKLVDLIKRHHIDLIVTHDYKANFFGRRAAKKTGIKQAAHFRGRTTEDRKVLLYNWIDNRVLRKLEHILVVSEKSREIICALGIEPERVMVVPNGFDMSRALTERSRPENYIDPIRMIAAGRLSREKGYDILVEALSLLKENNINFEMDIFGEGPDQALLGKMIADHHLAASVKLRGFMPDLLPEFRRADLMVLPSRSEGMPNVVLEAWSQHLGVVATAVGGLPEMISHGENGLLVKPENPDDLADKLKIALSDRDKMYEYGRMGYETLVERYSFQRQALLLDRIYKQILGTA